MLTIPLARRYRSLPARAQAAFSALSDAAITTEHVRSIATLGGSFSERTIKGKTYWYYRHTAVDGRERQLFLGPDSPAIRDLVQKKRSAASQQGMRQLAKAAAVLGCTSSAPAHLKVIRRLADYGFFHAGGVAIGSHAFIAYANMLGVHWGGDASAMTMDVDFAHAGRNLSVALQADIQINTSSAIESLQMGFVPLLGGSDKGGGTWVNPNDPDFTLDFVTPQTDELGAPFLNEQLGVSLQPLRFMEYSLEDVQQTVLFDASGAVLINVPHPARYALHKLIIYGERSGLHRAKAGKDLLQSALLLHILREQRPFEIEEAWVDLMRRGKDWRSRATAGLQALQRAYPEEGYENWLTTAYADWKSAEGDVS
jgi:hypothetical protein